MSGNPHIRKYDIDKEKLFEALDKKRRNRKHPWEIVSHKVGVSVSVLTGLKSKAKSRRVKKTINADVFVSILMYINRPYKDFIVENREVGNGYQDSASS